MKRVEAPTLKEALTEIVRSPLRKRRGARGEDIVTATPPQPLPACEEGLLGNS